MPPLLGEFEEQGQAPFPDLFYSSITNDLFFCDFCAFLWLRTEAVFLEAAIERAAAETEGFGGAVGVALESGEGFFD